MARQPKNPFHPGEILLEEFLEPSGTTQAALAEKLGAVYRVVQDKFYIDEIYLFVTKKILFRFVARPIAWFDRNVVDGAVNLTANMTRLGGVGLSKLQTGQVQTYAFWFVNGAIGFGLLIWLWIN